MPDKVVDGAVQKIESDDNPIVKSEVQIDDAKLAEMAAKSGDTVEHMKKILGLYDKQDDKATATDDKTADDKTTEEKLLAGKFKTDEDLDKGIQSLIDKYGKETAYKMLEANMGKDKVDTKATGTDEGAKDALTGEDDKTQTDDKDGDDKPIDMDKFYTEFSDNGQLSIESYKELADAGFDKNLVDSYIAGQEAIVERFTNKVHTEAGGEEQFNAMVAWGTTNLTDAEKVNFNKAVNSGDFESAKTVLDALKGRYEKAEGTFKRASITPSDSVNGSDIQGYASAAEMSAAMRDPRYKTDPAYVRMVEKKVSVSKGF